MVRCILYIRAVLLRTWYLVRSNSLLYVRTFVHDILFLKKETASQREARLPISDNTVVPK